MDVHLVTRRWAKVKAYLISCLIGRYNHYEALATPSSRNVNRSSYLRREAVKQIRSLRPAVVMLSIAVLLAGCKEGDLGPELAGGIDGLVLDYATSQPVRGASVTTSPPTDALLTDAQGRFSLREIEAGNYTISARKQGYQPNTVTVGVRENRTAQATIFLEDGPDEGETESAIDVTINEWWSTTKGDSAYVHVEYVVTNSGTVDLRTYDVNFRIDAGAAEFYHQETGGDLKRGRSNVGGFDKYTRTLAADSVRVASIWFE